MIPPDGITWHTPILYLCWGLASISGVTTCTYSRDSSSRCTTLLGVHTIAVFIICPLVSVSLCHDHFQETRCALAVCWTALVVSIPSSFKGHITCNGQRIHRTGVCVCCLCVCMCMCVSICVHVSVCVCMCVCACECVRARACACVYPCVSVCVCVCVCMHVCPCACVCVCACMHACMHACTCVRHPKKLFGWLLQKCLAHNHGVKLCWQEKVSQFEEICWYVVLPLCYIY